MKRGNLVALTIVLFLLIFLLAILSERVMNGPPGTEPTREDLKQAELQDLQEYKPVGGIPFRSQSLGFSSISNYTSQEDTFASLEIARNNSDYILVVSRVNWLVYFNGWENKSDPEFEKLVMWKAIANYYGLDLYVAIDVLESGDRKLIDQSIPWDKSFANPNVRAAVKSYAKKVVTEINPPYLTVGMEINTYAGANPEDYENFVTLFDETYLFVKMLNVKIGPTLQYEELTDCGTDIENQYDLIDDFYMADFIGLSSYARFCFNSFSEIPEDYYSRIRQHTQKSLIIGESGWPTNSTLFPSTELDQKLFLNFLLLETNKLNMDLVIWWFMHDCYDPVCLVSYDPNQFFISSGLIESSGQPKESWAVWREYYRRSKLSANE